MRPLIVTPWASTTNYPAGGSAWSGQPVKVVPAGTFFTPATGASAEEMNYLIGRVETAIKGIADCSADIGAQNWINRYVPFFGGSTSATIAWDPFYRRWLAFGHDGTNCGPYQSLDGGGSYQTLGSTFASDPPIGCAVRPSDGLTVVITRGVATGNFFRFTTANVHTNFLLGSGIDTGSIVWFAAASLFVIVGQGATANFARTSPDGVTWTNQSASIVSGFGGGSQVRTHQAQSPTRLCVFAERAVGYTSYMRTDDTVTWTTGTIGVGGSEIVKGAGYDSARGLFVVVVTNATNTRIFTSSDGVTWSVVSTLNNYAVGSFAVAGSQYLMFATNALGDSRTLFSNDGGTTWRVCGYVGAVTDRLFTSGFQYASVLAGGAPTAISTSLAIGPSDSV